MPSLETSFFDRLRRNKRYRLFRLFVWRKPSAEPGAGKALAIRIEIKTSFDKVKKCRLTSALEYQKEDIRMTNDNKSLAHTSWNCKYHIVLPIVISITQGFTSIPKAKS